VPAENGTLDIPAVPNAPVRTHDLNVVYKTAPTVHGERDLHIDIFYPENIIYEKSPLLIGFHGGGWIAGDRLQIMYIFAPVIEKLRANGYIVATVEYRMASDAVYFPAQIEDCIDAILYLKNNAGKYNINIDSIGLIGYSAGAQLAMLASYAMAEFSVSGETADIKYCLSFAGPAKFYGSEFSEYSRSTAALIEIMIGGTYDEKESEYMRSSPYYHIGGTVKVPLFLAHDEQDGVVPFSQSRAMYDKAAEAGIPGEFLRLRGFYHQIDLNHIHRTTPPVGEAVDSILDFIYKYSQNIIYS
jgi:acetyl esterase/lipase